MPQQMPAQGAKPEVNMAKIAAVGGGFFAGGIGGAVAWSKHPVLGFLAGSSAGATTGTVATSGAQHATGLLLPVGAVAGSMMWKKHPVGGFWLGALCGGMLAGLSRIVLKK